MLAGTQSTGQGHETTFAQVVADLLGVDMGVITLVTGDTKIITVGACFTACHGNEPGTLKEVVSLNTGGPAFIVMGAPIVLVELGMVGITGSPGFLNKGPG